MKFKSDIETQAGLVDSFGFTGSPGQILSSTGNKTEWITPPQSPGTGGSSVFYYLNGSIPSSVAGYQQMSNTAIIGGGTNFNLAGNGLIAQFLTDIGNPNRVEIPGGAWNFEMYFQASSSGGNEKFYVELLKYNGSTFTSIASSAAAPEQITGGTSIDLYLASLAVPTTTLLVTDRLVIRVYIVNNSGGRTITLHTEDSTLCQVITTFPGGVTSINGITKNTQYLATGTSGTDFNIASAVDTHTFNLPTASATNRGALSSTDWNTFNNKQGVLNGTGFVKVSGTTVSYDNSTYVPTSRTITINGNTQDLSANRIFNIDTGVTSFNTRTGAVTLTSGDVTTALGYAPINVTIGTGNGLNLTTAGGFPTQELNLFLATASQNGALSSTDWTTFNNKVPPSRTITINGVTQDLSANRTFTVPGGVSGSGAVGQVAYWNGTTSITGESNLFWDSTNDRLGIGTATPGTSLHVYKSTYPVVQLESPLVTGNIGIDTSSNFMSFGTSTNHDVSFATNNTPRMRITSGGNVGINTQSPITVSGHTSLTVNSSATPRIDLTVGNSQRGLIAALDSQFLIYSQSAIPLILGTNDTERMRIFSSGNVFIGPLPTDAGYKLDVNGTGRFSGAYGNSAGLMVSGTTYGLIGANRGASNSSAGVQYYSVGTQKWFSGIFENTDDFGFYSTSTGGFPLVIKHTTGRVGIGTTTPAEKLDVIGGAVAAGNGTIRTGITYSSLGLIGTFTNHDLGIITNGSEKMRITSGGNVGIGTITPDNKLDVRNTVSTQIRMGTDQGARPYWNIGRDNVTTGNFVIGDETSIKMSITNGGSVGIGNINPGTKLDVTGNVRVNGSNLLLDFTGNVGGIQWGVNPFIQGVANGGFEIRDNTNQVSRLCITSGGNVGIGTTDVDSRLKVELINVASLRVAYNGTSVNYYDANENIFRSGAGTERMRIFPSGNVFIGPSPTDNGAKLNVNGTVFASATGGFGNATYAVNVRNPIWRFGNADGYGLSFFQGTAGIGGVDTIGIHNGTATAAGSQFQFIANGNAVFSGTSTATGFFNSSDIRLKDIISQDGDIIEFTWKDGRDNKKHIGYIAQDIQKTMPDAVNEGEDGMLSVNYIEVLVKKIQDLENRIKQLEK